MIDELLLNSGMDIPFPEAQTSIRQPKLKDIALVGEKYFYNGCELLNFSKNKIASQDKVDLEGVSNFEILMSIVTDKNVKSRQTKANFFMMLALLFPEYRVLYNGKDLILVHQDDEEDKHYINKDNFENFQVIIREMFNLNDHKENAPIYNPGGNRAQQIAEKLMKGRQKAAEQKGENNQKVNILSRYASILAIGNHLDFNDVMNYTVYQLYDQFQRFELKQQNEFYLQAKMAGAKDLEEVDNWMKDIHS